MMKVKYYYEFTGLDNILNRVEILTASAATATEVTGSGSPCVVSYDTIDKLDPVQGSGATLGMISEEIFQFIGLHTDKAQEYLVKIYRDGKLFWIGWLDSELYSERLSDYPPYPVEFTAADFNILERLQYRDGGETRYKGIVSMWDHLRRCLGRLGLPFGKIHVGCSTTVGGVTMAASETPLHVLYVTSDNFYDEDGEPMKCREVVESLLRPFALTMTQRDGDIYIYDYNTILSGGPMKRYDYASGSYEAAETVDCQLGDLSDLQLAGSGGDFGFEEMINNVTITSSIYADDVKVEPSIEADTVHDKVDFTIPPAMNAEYFRSCEGFENLSASNYFTFYKGEDFVLVGPNGEDTVKGYEIDYQPSPASVNALLRLRYPTYAVRPPVSADGIDGVALRVALSAYPSGSDQPAMSPSEEELENSQVMYLYCNLYVEDANGNPTAYFDNDTREPTEVAWKNVSGSVPQGKFILWFSTGNVSGSVMNAFTTNANKVDPLYIQFNEAREGKGLYMSLDKSGFLVFEVTNKAVILDPSKSQQVDSSKVKLILLDDFSLGFTDLSGNELSSDDYEFKSYINKNVKNDFGDVTLKCITANEEMEPGGRANILRKTSDGYDYALSFTRAGQTDILERLLMCSIHSNFSDKKEKFGFTIELNGNPIAKWITYSKYLQGKYLPVSATIDLRQAASEITVVGFSDDVAQLSDIEYA